MCLLGYSSQSRGRPWWRHQMETFSALLAICAGNSPVPDEFPAQRPVTRSFDVSFDLRLNKRLSKQSWGWWFETRSHPLWRHCNVNERYIYLPNNICIKLEHGTQCEQVSNGYPPVIFLSFNYWRRIITKPYVFNVMLNLNDYLQFIDDYWSEICLGMTYFTAQYNMILEIQLQWIRGNIVKIFMNRRRFKLEWQCATCVVLWIKSCMFTTFKGRIIGFKMADFDGQKSMETSGILSMHDPWFHHKLYRK